MAKISKTPLLPEPVADVLAPVAEDVAVDYPRNLDRLLTTATQNTRAGIEIRDQLTALLRQRHAAIEAFIDEQTEGGLSLEEVVAFAAVETPLLPTVTTVAGKVTVTWPFRISFDENE